ncbi:MAG: ATP-binding cassette domain-containing protein [Solirubrobacteraceae bacterium]|nr:ATP-binding cassette domain-containing protein [Solirubrobacteraceae bacterium]
MGLSAEHLSRRFGDVVAVDDLNFELPAGQVIGLLGPNGAGKSTTIRMAMGLLDPDGGSIAWNGTPAAGLDRRIVGYLPEEIGVYERMTVRDHITFFAELHGRSRSDARGAAERWAERLELPAAAVVSSLSKGNQQRVQLASALGHDPELIVLDEPFSGLDPIGQTVVEDLMTELAATGATLVLSSHDLERVERFCSYVALISSGRLRYDGSVDGLRARHPQLRRRVLELAEASPALESALPALERVDAHDPLRLAVQLDDMEPEPLLRAALDHGARVVGLAVVEPTMRELFVREVEAA